MNYKMRPDVVKDIRDHVDRILERRLDYAKGAFPLSFEEVKRAVMTDHQHELVESLQDTGFNQFRSSNTVSIFVDRDEYPDMRRSAAVHLALPEYVVMPRQVFLQFRDSKRITPNDMVSSPVTSLYRLLLDASQRDALAKWTTRMIRETRLHDLVRWAVWRTLSERISPTTGHLLALWPTLATLTTLPDWRTRFRNPPKKLRDFAPKAPTVAELHKEIEVADTILHGGEMLEAWEKKPRAIQPTLVAWEWLERDRAYEVTEENPAT